MSVEIGQAAPKQLGPSHVIDCILSPLLKPGEALIISGFWRSGTTWVQQLAKQILNAKTVFEPLEPSPLNSEPMYSVENVPSTAFRFLRLFMPFCREHLSEDEIFHDYIRRALLAQIVGTRVRRLRAAVWDSLRRTVVVKTVRAHLSLSGITNTYNNPIMHVYRDPRAVMASVKREGWGRSAGLYALSLEEQLLAPTDGRSSYFAQWHDIILQRDHEGDVVGRISAYWALLERYVEDTCCEQLSRFLTVRYESLCKDCASALPDLFSQLNLRVKQEMTHGAVFEDSASTQKARHGISIAQRLRSWQTELTRSEIQTIEDTALFFDLEHRLG